MSSIVSSIRGQQVICFTYSHVAQRLLVQTSDNLYYLTFGRLSNENENLGAHRDAVCGIAYNPVFNCIISCCDNQVKVWDAATGKKILMFQTHRKEPSKGKEEPECLTFKESENVECSSFPGKSKSKDALQGSSEAREKRKEACPNPQNCGAITCLCVDRGGSRLLTGHQKGIVKEWNFTNGMCLKSMYRCDGCPTRITAICYASFMRRSNIIAVGWDRRINIFSCDPKLKDEGPQTTWVGDFTVHHEDIWAVTSWSQPEIVVTAGFDGDIVFWNFASGRAEHRIRPPDFR